MSTKRQCPAVRAGHCVRLVGMFDQMNNTPTQALSATAKREQNFRCRRQKAQRVREDERRRIEQNRNDYRHARGWAVRSFIASRGFVEFNAGARADLLKRYGVGSDELLIALTKLAKLGHVELGERNSTITARIVNKRDRREGRAA